MTRPKIILGNAIDDRHPDHPRGAQLVREAFFFSGLKKITSIQGEPFRADALYHYIQDKQLTPDFCTDITPFVDQKMQSIKAFSTQFYQGTEEESNNQNTNFLQIIYGLYACQDARIWQIYRSRICGRLQCASYDRSIQSFSSKISGLDASVLPSATDQTIPESMLFGP